MSTGEWVWIVVVFTVAMLAVAGVAMLDERWENRERRRDEPPSQLDEWDRPRSTDDDGWWIP